jgi:hypothetical protein
MRLVLALPGLLASGVDAQRGAPRLARLLAASGVPASLDHGIGAALAPNYGVVRQTDWPLAPIRLAHLGVDPEEGYWLNATPVTLVATHDDIRFAGAVLDLGREEAAALIASLATHFAADGIAFVAPVPDAWFVRAPAAPDLATRPLDALAGRALRDAMPDGRDARTWRRWQNEIQMLLVEHPVNVARAKAGRAPANSVWLSEGGVRPPAVPLSAPIRTWANGGIAAALASHVGARASKLPESLDPLLAEARSDATLVAALDDTLDLAHVERAWAAPAARALARGTLDAVTLIGDGDGHAAMWTARRAGVWQRLAAALLSPDLAALLAAVRD